MIVKKYNGGVYGGSNTYICINNNKAIIIDAGVSLEVFQNDLKDIDVVAVFITHAHFDHIYYLEDYMEKYNPELYISDNGYRKLYDSYRNMSLWFKEEMLEEDSESTFEEIILSKKYLYNPLLDNENIIEAGLKIKAIYTPGHSSCSFTFIVNEDTAFVGDLIFKNGVGRTDFDDGDSQTLVKSIMRLKEFSKLRHIHSGHGESTHI